MGDCPENHSHAKFLLCNMPERKGKTITVLVVYLQDLVLWRCCSAVLPTKSKACRDVNIVFQSTFSQKYFLCSPKPLQFGKTEKIISQTSPTSDCKYKVMQKRLLRMSTKYVTKIGFILAR